MILRVSEALVAPDTRDEFLDRLRALVADFPAEHDGLVDHDVLVDLDDPLRVQYLSRWRDESALVAYAGPAWRTDPVTFPDEDRYLTEPLTLRHFTIN